MGIRADVAVQWCFQDTRLLSLSFHSPCWFLPSWFKMAAGMLSSLFFRRTYSTLGHILCASTWEWSYELILSRRRTQAIGYLGGGDWSPKPPLSAWAVGQMVVLLSWMGNTGKGVGSGRWERWWWGNLEFEVPKGCPCWVSGIPQHGRVCSSGKYSG